jgi:hypothetical protein
MALADKMLDDMIEDVMRKYPQVFIDERLGQPGSGKAIAPDLDDEQFATTWFALQEYKTMLEMQLFQWTRRGTMIGHVRSKKKWQRLHVSNTPFNLEDQEFTYQSLHRLAKQLFAWLPRAQALGLI